MTPSLKKKTTEKHWSNVIGKFKNDDGRKPKPIETIQTDTDQRLTDFDEEIYISDHCNIMLKTL